ncbi:MAG: phosphodiester glycosidase family protein [Flavobacteriaceae bacterium]
MKYPINYTFLFLLSISFFTGCSQDNSSEKVEKPIIEVPKTAAEKIASATWVTKEPANGIKWKYLHFDDLFSSRQSVTVIEISGVMDNVKVAVPYVESGFLKTSDAGINTRAIAAVNGSYFDTSNGGSTTFLKENGSIVNHTRPGFDWYRENAGFAINASGGVSIIQKPASGWASVDDSTLMVSGPLLLMDGEALNQSKNAFNDNRHPRTAVGITKEGNLINVVVDGRASEAHGVSIEELTILMKALGCVNAMNLDGGGSSTAWVKNYGVVSYPSDNKKFDHEGERGVATVITYSSSL